MKKDFSWKKPAKEYLKLYKRLTITEKEYKNTLNS